MKCQEFAQIVVELARGQMMDAAQQTRGLAHAEACVHCAAWLTRERALTAGLRALAASDEELSAPASAEAALLAAFRQQAQQKVMTPTVAPAPVLVARWPRWAWAAAAVILLALSLIALRAMRDQTPHEVIVQSPLPTPAVTPSTEQRVAPPAGQAETHDARPASRPERLAQRVAHRRPINQDKQRPQRFLIRDSMTLYASDSEVTSDFFPLTDGAQLPPLESGQLIRVQMPRSALVAYGLPVNLARADAPLKADLLVGEDGQARAIRFVR